MIIRRFLWLVFFGMLAARTVMCLDPTQQFARDILGQLVDINTADSAANVTAASEAMAKRLRDAGFPEADIRVDGDDPRFKNLVARYRGAGKAKPILLL